MVKHSIEIFGLMKEADFYQAKVTAEVWRFSSNIFYFFILLTLDFVEKGNLFLGNLMNVKQGDEVV